MAVLDQRQEDLFKSILHCGNISIMVTVPYYYQPTEKVKINFLTDISFHQLEDLAM